MRRSVWSRVKTIRRTGAWRPSQNERQRVRRSVRRSTQGKCQNKHVTSRTFTHGMMMALSSKAWQTARVTKYAIYMLAQNKHVTSRTFTHGMALLLRGNTRLSLPSTCLQSSLRKVVRTTDFTRCVQNVELRALRVTQMQQIPKVHLIMLHTFDGARNYVLVTCKVHLIMLHTFDDA